MRERDTDLVLIPEVKSRNTLELARPYLSLQRLQNSIVHLEDLQADNNKKYVWDPLLEYTVWTILDLYDKDRDLVHRWFDSHKVQDHLKRTYPDRVKDFRTGKRLENDPAYAIREIFSGLSGSFFTVSESHLSLMYQIMALKKSLRHPSDVPTGLVVFDKHIDLYSRDSDRSDLFGVRYGKHNFLKLLLDEGYVSAVTIIGVQATQLEQLQYGKRARVPISDDLLPTYEFYQKYSDKIFCIAAEEFSSPQQAWKPGGKDNLRQQLLGMDDVFERNRVERVITSFDLDALRLGSMKYSAMEYAPWGVLMALGFKDLENISKEDLKLEHLIDLYASVWNLPREVYSTRLVKDDFHGMPLAAAGITLDHLAQSAKSNLYRLGYPVGHGGLFVGDLTELSLSDYRGKTTRATMAYIQRHEKAVRDSVG